MTVPKGETTAMFTVATAEDALDENNETFTVALSSPSSNATLAADATTATGTITDDDARPALIIADMSAPEESNVEFTVTLTPASGRTVTVGWGTFLNIGQTAEEEDFTSFPQNGFVTFPPGQTTAQLQVTVVDDEFVESDETFEVTLGSARNARLEDNSAIGTIVDNDVAPNAAPTFTSAAMFNPAENQTAVGTVRVEDFDGDAITDYALSGGADQALFSIGSTSGALTFLTAPDYENPQDANTDNAYVVVVRATSGKDARVMTADQTITVTVMDDDTEAPGAPDAPSVSPASVTSLTVTWLAPDNAGPAITDYDVQYRAGTSAPWSDGSHIGTALTAILTGLLEDTSYQVQVRATNAEGTGGWSASGSGATDANAAPSFTSSATFTPAENQTAVGTVEAEDSDTTDDITGYALSGGADQALFSINNSGVLTFQAAPNYEDPQDANTDNAYVVVVQATSGTGDREQTGTQTITVRVMDDDTEAPGAPGAPDAPSVSPASVTSLTVTWLAPDNAGPAITDYDVQYRAGTSGPWSDGSHIGTALTAILTGLLEDTSYRVQVRATNAEGTGGWSASGSGATDANAAPSFTSSTTFNPAENQTAVGTVEAEDSDTTDDITGYALSGGADQALFSINNSGVLTFQAAPNYEDPQDANTDNAYVVVVQATSGTGDREQTATQTITVTVMDDDTEAPAAPDAPSVSPASVTSLNVTWPAPDNAGPAITDYDVQYRAGTSAPWSDGSHIGTALTAILTGLLEDTSYQVQVRATNAEGTGGWSASGSGATDANAAPSFTSSATFTPAENQTAVGTVRASDSDTTDDITDYALSGGTDQALFAIGSTSGVLTFLTASNYEDPQDANTDNAYVVVVQATSGTGDREQTGTQTITVRVMDDDTEAPGAPDAPDAPSVSPASVTSLTVTWPAPDNAGPAITDYDVQYRAGTSAPWSDGSHIGTALTAILTGLLEDTSYQVQVRATNAEGTGGWSASGSGATDANAAPSFTSSATFTPAENQTAVGTVRASDSDTTDDITDYALSGGTDQALFAIGSTSGVLTFLTAPNYEDPQDANTDNAYVVVVQATSGTGDREQTGTQTITVRVMDDDTEAPGAPDAPSVSPASVTSLTVTWLAPDNAGPAITDYDVQYRAGTSGPWSDGSHIGTALTAILTGLLEDTSYQVQVRATNAEGTGGWSASGSGAADANAAPSFTSSTTFTPAENQTAVGTVRASDSDTTDEITDYALSGGTDQALFAIGSTSGVLTFQVAPNYEAPQDANTDNAYVVVVQATSGTGDREQTGTQTITVTVMDDDTEAPAAPDAPSVAPASVTSLNVTWPAPDNAGPEITDYDVQYRAGTSAQWSDGSHIGTALTAILTGLLEDTSYQVQVRATNAEGTGGWSASGSGATDANAAPSFTSSATFTPAENQTAVGTVRASDSDTGDNITDYALSGGADQALFSIGSTSGVLTFQAAPNYEDPQDANTDNAYLVVVQATSGTGDREQTGTQTITVTVMDDDTEAPAAPDAPSVAPASVTSLTVTWLAPDNDGPEITDYDVQYRAGTSAPWSDGSHIGTALTAILTGLLEDTSYQVQVRATNAEGTGGWSASGSGETDANAAPSFTSSTTFTPAENQTAVGTVRASDSDAGDEVTDYALSGGTDQALFSIGSTSGVLTFQAAPNYEDPQDANTDNAYLVVVQATSGTGDREQTGTQTITVTVMDDDTEAPAAPDAPSVSPASVTSLTVTWLAPDNDGPAITDYDYRYRTTSPPGAWMAVTNTTIAALSATIAGLLEDTSYQVQVRATNAEGTGGWSASGSGATDANAAPSFTSAATFTPAENQTAVGTVRASDSDAGDEVTDYALSGGADQALFSIGSTSGVLTFLTAPNYEDPQDANTDNAYLVVVQATSGTGDREQTGTQTITVTVMDADTEAPAAPDAPSVSPASVTSLTVTWLAPDNAGPAITDYDYRYRTTSPPGAWMAVTNTTITARSTTIGSLQENTEYDVQVRATNDEGTGGWSASGSGTTEPLRDNDGRPTGLQAAPRSPTVIQLSWTAPEYVGSFSITGYRVEASENASGPWSVVAADTRNTRPSWGHGGLSAGDTRHYRVSAISPAGTSGPSNVASATTIAAGPAGTNPALPVPTSVSAVPQLPGEIRLTWWRDPDAPSKDLVDRHQYRYRVRDAGAWTVDWTTVNQTLLPEPWPPEIRNANKVLLQGLTAGTTYEFQVRSVDTDGGTSAAVAVLGTATGRQTVWIEADTGSVAEGEPLRFTVSRDQPHGPMMAIVRISETEDMLPPDGRSPEGYWHEQVPFGDGNESIPLVLDTVNDGGGTEPDSRVTVEVMSYPLHPDNPDNEHLYDVDPELGAATITVTAATEGSSPGSAAEPLTAAFDGLPAAHDGETAFTFRLAFSEAVAVTPEAMRTHVLEVVGGAVTGAARVAGASGVWAVTVTPDSREELSIALAPATECAADGAVCTSDGRALSGGLAHIVRGPGPETGPAPLTATFPESAYASAQHTGPSDRPQVVVAFSAPVAAFGADTPSVSATGASVDGVQRLDKEGLEHAYVFFLTPEGHQAIVFRLHANRACPDGGICTADRRRLSNSPSATVAGPSDDAPEPNTAATGAPTISGTAQVGEALTASTSGISDADGLADARFAYQWIRTDTDIGGATGATYTPVDADEGTRLQVRVSFTDDAGHAERLTSAATDAVAAALEPLTASFEDLPAEHRGQGSFTFRVAFSDGISISYTTVRDASFRVTGGDVTGANRVDGRRDLWRITIEPDADETVTVRLPETTDCGARGAICTGDGRRLSHALSATVAGPVGIAVADARVEEGDGVALAFVVTLSRAASAALTVDYATADGSAHAGDDYRAASGMLKFRAGEASKTIEVAVLDDAHDEGEETLTLRLSNPSGGRLTDGEATGTIANHDSMPRALLARFGRTAAVHVVEHVEERLAAPRAPGFRGRFAGRELRRGMERDIARNVLRQLGGAAGTGSTGAGVHGSLSGAPSAMGMADGPMGDGSRPPGRVNGGGLLRMGLGGGDVLTGSDVALGRETGHGGILSFWSRGSRSRFSGREGALSLGGDVRTTMVGADYATGPLVTGLSLSHSRGLGEYAGVAGGQVASSVTGLYPWLGYKATDRITVWGVAGYGAGGLRLTPQGGPALASGLSMAMAAAGTRGELVAGGAGGVALAFKTDALWVGTSIDGVDGAAGRLKATDTAVTRFRTGLEGSRAYTLADRLSLTPSVEVGLRHDGGDAETGAGMDVGGGLVMADAATGLAVDLRVRTLVLHQAEGFRERGLALSLRYNPTPSTPLGFVARVAPSWGGQATSGAEALWGQETMAGMAPGGGASGTRLDGEVGYGLAVGRRFVGTPTFGVGTFADGRDYRLGYRLGALGGEGTAFDLGVDAQRRERPLPGGTDHGALARATMRW